MYISNANNSAGLIAYRGSALEMTGGLRSVARMSCAEFAGSLDPYVPGDVPSTKNISFMTTIGIIRAVYTTFSSITSSATSPDGNAQREVLH